MSLMMFVGASIVSLLTQPFLESFRDSKLYIRFGVAYAWIALGVMTGAWLADKPVHWHWPVVGGLIGILCCAVFAVFVPLYLPCVLLGLYLCYFHLAGKTAGKNNAASQGSRIE